MGKEDVIHIILTEPEAQAKDAKKDAKRGVEKNGAEKGVEKEVEKENKKSLNLRRVEKATTPSEGMPIKLGIQMMPKPSSQEHVYEGT